MAARVGFGAVASARVGFRAVASAGIVPRMAGPVVAPRAAAAALRPRAAAAAAPARNTRTFHNTPDSSPLRQPRQPGSDGPSLIKRLSDSIRRVLFGPLRTPNNLSHEDYVGKEINRITKAEDLPEDFKTVGWVGVNSVEDAEALNNDGRTHLLIGSPGDVAPNVRDLGHRTQHGFLAEVAANPQHIVFSDGDGLPIVKGAFRIVSVHEIGMKAQARFDMTREAIASGQLNKRVSRG